MFAPVVSILVIISLLIGGAGASVYAAQGSLPDESLYALKTMSEDLRLRLATSPQESINLALDYTNRRLEEIHRLAERGEPIPQTVVLRWQAQLDLAFRHAASIDDAHMLQALERMRLQLQIQLQALQQLRERLGARGEPGLLQAEEMLRKRLQWAEDGQIGPESLRQLRQRFQQGAGMNPAETPTTSTPGGAQLVPGPAGSATAMPGGGYGFGGPPEVNLTPSAGYGPGPGPAPSSTCTPRAGQTATPQGSGGQIGSPSAPGSTTLPGSNPSRTPQAGDGGGPQPGSTCAPNAGPGPQPTPGGDHGGSGRP